MEVKKQATIIRVILVDVFASVCATMMFCAIVMIVLDLIGAFPETGNGEENLTTFFLALIILFSVPIYLRAKYINKLITQGIEYTATISSFARGGGMADGIWYEYMVNGKLYKKYYAAIYYKYKIQKGIIVTASADINNPKRSVIRELFIC